MCGITGFLETRSSGADPLAVVTSMTRQLAHRGPDDEGVWFDPSAGIALGQRRLSILDLSPLGHQPMFSLSGRFVLVFNGEIYNFAAIRAELASSGAAFRGGSDTEVMLAAFERWGVSASLSRFNGMFAFALWDRSTRRLTLARDRFGEKPLYFGWTPSAFLFASELKALHCYPDFDAAIDRDVLALYFRYNYIPGPYSIYKGIQKLPPGTWLEIDSRRPGSSLHPTPYWSAHQIVEAGQQRPFPTSEDELTDALDLQLRSTVQSRMVSDVPLGAFLSGGVDSSLVVSMMQECSARPVKTFTIAFEDPSYNEANHARAVAGHLRTDHTELRVTPSEALGVIPYLAGIYDEPFADASQIPTLLIASLAREHVTVALTGDGGDELFGGYTRYSWHDTLLRLLMRVPSGARGIASGVLDTVPRFVWESAFRVLGPLTPRGLRQRNPAENVQRLRAILRAADSDDVYRQLVSIWPDPSSIVKGSREPDAVVIHPGLSSTTRLMLLDTMSYLPDDILVKVDRASMSVALEARAPFLDHTLFEFAARLPLGMKMRSGQGKWILRRVLDRYVPRTMIERPKAGFAVPLDDWLRGRLRPWAEDLLPPSRLAADDLLNAAAVTEKWREHLTGRQNWMFPLWGALMFQSWLDNHRASHPLAAPIANAQAPLVTSH